MGKAHGTYTVQKGHLVCLSGGSQLICSRGLPCSHESGLREQEEEGALDWSGWVDERSLVELAKGPELQQVEVVRADHNVVVESAVLEEESAIAPERADLVGARDDPADEIGLAAELRRFVEGENFEHHGVRRDDGDLVPEVVLVVVGPAVHVVGLELELDGPVRVCLPVTVLIVLGDFHD